MAAAGATSVTVTEYMAEFWARYNRRAYGRSLLQNAAKGADTLMGAARRAAPRQASPRPRAWLPASRAAPHTCTFAAARARRNHPTQPLQAC